MLVKHALYADTALPVLKGSLDATSLRAKAIANNLANAATPGYRRLEVSFEDNLREALDRAREEADRPGRIAPSGPRPEQVRPRVRVVEDPVLPGEINNVDIDWEAAGLAENHLLFLYGTKLYKDRKADLEAAIKGMAG